MLKTLVVTYTAREGSNTKKLGDHFIETNKDKTEITVVCLAVTPMYNFSLPGTVKAWFDAIIQLNKTFSFSEQGELLGLLKGRKALSLMTSGSDFSKPPFDKMDFAIPLINTCFGFMGVEPTNIHPYGSQDYAENYDKVLVDACKKIDTLSAEWYN